MSKLNCRFKNPGFSSRMLSRRLYQFVNVSMFSLEVSVTCRKLILKLQTLTAIIFIPNVYDVKSIISGRNNTWLPQYTLHSDLGWSLKVLNYLKLYIE